ncbi:MAG: hypothetical protein DRQ51_01540 [Gammaproteobacteria bacterium]|nr:MAG: hypothetical protein DRQ51_01540 [Gammaproteobacteria bacterium]
MAITATADELSWLVSSSSLLQEYNTTNKNNGKMRPLHNSSTIYKTNRLHMLIAKIRQRACHIPHFCYKNALFFAFSKQHLNYAKVSKYI